MRYKHEGTGDIVEAMQLPALGLPASEALIAFLQSAPDGVIMPNRNEGVNIAITDIHGRDGIQIVNPCDWVVKKPDGVFCGIYEEEFKREFRSWEN